MRSHLCELVRVAAADGVRVDGALLPAHRNSLEELGADAVVLLHGTGSNFYAGGILAELSRLAVEAGLMVLRANSRGHDLLFGTSGPGGRGLGGAAVESLPESVFDVMACLRLLEDRGCQRILLVGHSMGGVKGCLALGLRGWLLAGHGGDPRFAAVRDFVLSEEYERLSGLVKGLVGLTPPRFCHQLLSSGARGEVFQREFARATALVEAGGGDQFLRVTQPLPYVTTAAGYVEKYGPSDGYDFVRYLRFVPCRSLVLIGEESLATSSAVAGLPEVLADLSQNGCRVVTRVIPGANIQYANDLSRPFYEILTWLRD